MTKTVILSGKKQAGKSTAAKYIFARIANKIEDKNRYSVSSNGEVIDCDQRKAIVIDNPSCQEAQELYTKYGIKIYSFADPLKEFVSNAFGLDIALLYGTDSMKNNLTHIEWENIPPNIRTTYPKKQRKSNTFVPAFGKMTIREILQVFGTDICRSMDENCWARMLYDKISKETYNYAIVADARFPNEITLGTTVGATAIRLLRNPFPSDTHPSETALDNFPLGEYTHIIDNTDSTLDQKNDAINTIITKEFNL